MDFADDQMHRFHGGRNRDAHALGRLRQFARAAEIATTAPLITATTIVASATTTAFTALSEVPSPATAPLIPAVVAARLTPLPTRLVAAPVTPVPATVIGS
jgi:hypothetical protein